MEVFRKREQPRGSHKVITLSKAHFDMAMWHQEKLMGVGVKHT